MVVSATDPVGNNYHLIQFLQRCSFVDCRFRVSVSSRVRVNVSFIFSCIFRFPV